jgi:hypothetical protein
MSDPGGFGGESREATALIRLGEMGRERDEARKWAEAAWARSDRAEKMLRIAAAKADQYRRALELIADDCEAWLNSESDEPSCDFIKLVAKYAREALQ